MNDLTMAITPPITPRTSDEPWLPTEEQLLVLIHRTQPAPEPDENGDKHCMRLWPVAECQWVSGHYGGCTTR